MCFCFVFVNYRVTMVISSQPASQAGELEAHFAALLEPIRDMAKNWDIDIAHHLEEYLEEVKKNFRMCGLTEWV